MRTDDGQPRIQDYTHLAHGYDASRYVSPADQLNERCRRQAFEKLLPARVDRALDVACGTGRGVQILQDHARHVVGADATMEMLRHAQQKTRQDGGYCQASGASLPFADATFDLVTCLNFLHLFPSWRDKNAFVAEIARVVKPNGAAVVEFDNALQGLVLGPYRKYLGRDIGYDWPWTIRSCFPDRLFSSVRLVGANVPFVWRVPGVRQVERAASFFPVKYLADRIFVGAVRSETTHGQQA